jgi:hypothetical protein
VTCTDHPQQIYLAADGKRITLHRDSISGWWLTLHSRDSKVVYEARFDDEPTYKQITNMIDQITATTGPMTVPALQVQPVMRNANEFLESNGWEYDIA